jgi:hypothetical protein
MDASHDDAAASRNLHQRSAAELTIHQAEVKRVTKEIGKVKKYSKSLEYRLESERQRSRSKEERVMELRAAAVELDTAHTAQLAKVCSQRDSWGRTVREFKAHYSSGSLSASRCRAQAMAEHARQVGTRGGGSKAHQKL